MKHLLTVVALILILVGVTSADPWLTPQWCYEFRSPALCLGSTWMEEGRLSAAVGQSGQISIIQNGRVANMIECPDLNVIALASVMIGDAPNLVTVAWDEVAWNPIEFDYHIFSGDYFGTHDTVSAGSIGGWWQSVSFDLSNYWIDETKGEDQNDIHPNFAFSIIGSNALDPHEVSEYGSGHFAPSGLEIGVPIWVERLPDDNGNHLVLAHQWEYWAWVERPFPQRASSEVNLKRISADGELINECAISKVETRNQYNDAASYCRAFGATIYDSGQNRTVLAAYSRIGNYYLQELSFPDLDSIRATAWSLDQPADLHIVNENGTDYLLAFVPDGRIITFNLTDWEEVESSRLNDGGVLATKVGNFDEDPGWEVLQLRTTDLTLYNLHALTTHSEQLPAFSFQLSAFPNPFNSTTTISYSLPRPGRYALDVVDIQGRLVTRLSDGWKEAGSYSAIWDGTGLSSGEYIVKLKSDKESFSKPVTLIK